MAVMSKLTKTKRSWALMLSGVMTAGYGAAGFAVYNAPARLYGSYVHIAYAGLNLITTIGIATETEWMLDLHLFFGPILSIAAVAFSFNHMLELAHYLALTHNSAFDPYNSQYGQYTMALLAIVIAVVVVVMAFIWVMVKNINRRPSGGEFELVRMEEGAAGLDAPKVKEIVAEQMTALAMKQATELAQFKQMMEERFEKKK